MLMMVPQVKTVKRNPLLRFLSMMQDFYFYICIITCSIIYCPFVDNVGSALLMDVVVLVNSNFSIRLIKFAGVDKEFSEITNVLCILLDSSYFHIQQRTFTRVIKTFGLVPFVATPSLNGRFVVFSQYLFPYF